MMRKFKNKNLVAAAIRKAASEQGILIDELQVMSDHVHLLAALPKNMTSSKAFQILKGKSAYLIFRNNEKFSLRYQRGHFWSAGGCASTVGQSDYETTKHYIRNQEQHHALA